MVFSVVALIVSTVALAQAGRSLEFNTELALVGGAIGAFGVPHGALDPVFARRLHGLKSVWSWSVFVLLYGAIAGLVVECWMIAPRVWLSGFLFLSALHFSGDLRPRTPIAVRILYGGAIIVLPSLVAAHRPDLVRAFSSLVGLDWATSTVSALRSMAWPWVVGLGIAALRQGRRTWEAGLEIASLGLLSVSAPPLIAFAVYFCFMHGARHVLRTVEYSGESLSRVWIRYGLLPLSMVAFLAFAAWRLMANVPVDSRLMQILFVGLAALTVPHMMLVERVRLGEIDSIG